MRHYRRLLVASVAGLGMIAAAFGQDAPPQAGRVVGHRKPVLDEEGKRQQLEALLKQWERKSAARKTAQVEMTRVDVAAEWEERLKFEGRAYFQSPNLASVEFWEVETKKPPALIKHDKLILAKDHVFQYVYPTQQIFVYPLAREERKRALEEGPLPFLFKMKAESVTARYKLSINNQNEHLYLIEIEPRADADKQAFVKAYLWLTKKDLLPQSLLMYLPDNKGKDTRQYTFKNVKWDKPLDPEIFRGKMYDDWKVVMNPAQ